MSAPAWTQHTTPGEQADLAALWGELPEGAGRHVKWYIVSAGDGIAQAATVRFLLRLAHGTTPRKVPPIRPADLAEGIIALRRRQQERGTPHQSAPGTLWGYLPLTGSAKGATGQAAPGVGDWKGHGIGQYPRVVSAPPWTGRCAMLVPYRLPDVEVERDGRVTLVKGGVVGICDLEAEEMWQAQRDGVPHVPYYNRLPLVHVVGVGNVYPDDPRHPYSGKPEAAVVVDGRYLLPTDPKVMQRRSSPAPEEVAEGPEAT